MTIGLTISDLMIDEFCIHVGTGFPLTGGGLTSKVVCNMFGILVTLWLLKLFHDVDKYTEQFDL